MISWLWYTLKKVLVNHTFIKDTEKSVAVQITHQTVNETSNILIGLPTSIEIISKKSNIVEKFNFSNSIENERIINKRFCVLRLSDTLAEAYSLLTIQGFTHVLVLDAHNKFVRTIKASSVVNRFPPPIKDIPISLRITEPKFQQNLNDSINQISKQTIDELFGVYEQSSDTYSHPQETVRYALSRLLHNNNDLLPVLYKDQILGTVTYKDFLKYFRRADFFVETKIEQLQESEPKPYVVLEPYHPLALADYIFNYLPVEYIVLATEDRSFAGMLDKQQIGKFMNGFYYHLIDMPLVNIVKTNETTYHASSGKSVATLVDAFLETDAEIVVFKDAASIKIFTPKTLLQSLVSALRIE